MMTLIADWLQAMGGAGVDVFWRPLLAWTLVFLPFYGALRLWRGAPALVQYHAHLALLLALPLSLALAPLVSWPAPEAAVFVDDVFPLPSLDGGAVALPGAAPEGGSIVAAAPQGLVWGPMHGVGLLTLFAAGCAVLLLIRMGYLAVALRRFRRRLAPVDDPRARGLLQALAREVGARADVALLVTPDDTTPLTFGWRRPVIVLPAGLLGDEAALRMTLLHELIHIRRWDYAVGWVVRLVSSLFAVHPGVWLLRRRIDQYREISCDAETLGGTPEGTGAYARLLVRFSPLADLAGPAALRIVNLDSTLKKRIHAMHNTLRYTPSLRLRRWSLPLAALLLLLPALLAACATENTSSETVIVTTDAEDAERDATTRDELAEREQELLLVEQKLALQRAERRAEQEHLEMKLVQEQQRELEAQHSGQSLKRLELQMVYLKEEILKASAVMDKLTQDGAYAANMPQAQRTEYEMTQHRVHLLNAMYMDRLEKFEMMKMEQFTEAVLHERADEE